MRVRAARRDDYDAVTALLEELGRPLVTSDTEVDCRAVYESQILDPNAHHIVIEGASGLVAFASLHFRSRLNHANEDAWVPDLIVTESARRQGVGRMLLDEAEQRARDRGCHVLTLESGYRRAEAHHMYRQFGMRDDGKYFVKKLDRPRVSR
jgi:GNAT superfamily N-acetyltransferase